MKICYIISTCDKYLDTRVKYQMESMFKNVNKADILPSKFKLTDNKKAKINNKEATVVAFDKFRKKSEEGSVY